MHDSLRRALITYGANIDVENNKGHYPLLLACRYGHLSAIDILIKEGADLNKKSSYDLSPIYIASQDKQSEIVQVIHIVALVGLNVLMKLKEYNFDLNAISETNLITPLHLAIQNNNDPTMPAC